MRILWVALLMAGMMLGGGWAYAQEIHAPFKNLSSAFFENPNPDDAVWNELSDAKVAMLPQNITTPGIQKVTIADVKVKALHNGKWLAVQLSWSDDKADMNVDTDLASDACAIQFPLLGADKTSPFMGAKEAPVAIMHWKAIWQNDVAGKYQDVTDLHPNTWYDFYFFATGKRPYPVTTSFESTAGRNTLGAVYVKNPIAQLHRTVPVEELMAEGFGTLTTQKDQDSRGNGVWKDGRWVVVFTRPLSSGDSHDPKMTVGKPTAIAFALWDGAKANVGALKNYAPWVQMTLEKKQ